MTRTIKISVPEKLLRLVDERAQSVGLDRDTYIHAILSKDVTGKPSIGEILFSFRSQVASSGISDNELDCLFIEAREESARNRRNLSKNR